MTETNAPQPRRPKRRAWFYQVAAWVLLFLGVPMFGFGALPLLNPNGWLSFVGTESALPSLACLVGSGPMLGIAFRLSNISQRTRVDERRRR